MVIYRFHLRYLFIVMLKIDYAITVTEATPDEERDYHTSLRLIGASASARWDDSCLKLPLLAKAIFMPAAGHHSCRNPATDQFSVLNFLNFIARIPPSPSAMSLLYCRAAL